MKQFFNRALSLLPRGETLPWKNAVSRRRWRASGFQTNSVVMVARATEVDVSDEDKGSSCPNFKDRRQCLTGSS